MSKPQGKKSSAASAPEGRDSVFEFFYHDPVRIASFLGQFDPSGVAQSLKRTDSSARSASDQSNDALKFNVGVASGQLGERIGATEGTQHGSERTYDPLWSNARAFLDYLAQRDMINDDPWSTPIGQFVLFSGALSVHDIAMLQQMWALPQFRKAAGLPSVAAKKHQNASAKAAGGDIEFAFEMLSIMPHQVQARIESDTASAWTTLKPDCLATPSGDLFLKHGLNIPGAWNMVGILDAQPDAIDRTEPVWGEMGAEIGAKLLQLFAPITRTMLGRPEDCFGLTPLLIFREVAGE